MSNAHSQAIVHRVITEIFNAGSVDVADDLVASDYVNHGGLIPDAISGPEAIKLSSVLLRRAFPFLCVSVDSLGIEGKLVILRWTGHNDAPGRQSSASGDGTLPGQLSGVTRVRCAAGRIAESWTEWDGAGAFGGDSSTLVTRASLLTGGLD